MINEYERAMKQLVEICDRFAALEAENERFRRGKHFVEKRRLEAENRRLRERYIELLTEVRDTNRTISPDDVAFVVFGDDWETKGTLAALQEKDDE